MVNGQAVVGNYSIGDYAQGGIIFWLDDSGRHGLVCHKLESLNIPWDVELEFDGNSKPVPERNTKSVAIADSIYKGKQNTKNIISFVGDTKKTYAALFCDNLISQEDSLVYADWYLPSREELNLLYLNRVVINQSLEKYDGDILEKKSYWSSTDVNCTKKPYCYMDNVHSAWAHNFRLGDKKRQILSRKYMSYAVRAIRAF